jgi:hypothetical protein
VALVRVAAVIVTRGDQDLTPVVTSLPEEWEVLVWDNGREVLSHNTNTVEVPRWPAADEFKVNDLSVYGRYAAIEYTDAELIYVQDDDVIVSDPPEIVEAWWERWHYATDDGMGDPVGSPGGDKGVVCNMPPEFRHEFYEEHTLVGFGACFHRDAPERAWQRFAGTPMETSAWVGIDMEVFRRTCDIVFTALTPRVLVDVPKEDLPWAHYEDRLWKQPAHQAERVRMLDLVRQIRD